jgi:hypothetical protein
VKIQKPSRELSIDENLTWTLDLYFRNFVMFFVPMIIAALVSGVLGMFLFDYISHIPPLDTGATQQEMLNWIYSYLPNLLLIVLAMGILSWLVSTIASGVVVKCASDSIEKGTGDLGKAFSSAVTKLPALLLAGLIYAILVGLGLVALIIPGIILAIMFSLNVPAIVIENAGPLGGLSRSRKLVGGRWLKTFTLFLIIVLIVGFIIFVGNLMAAPLGNFSWLASAIISAFVQPILPISLTVYYYSMLGREQQQRVPPPPAPPF